MLADVRPIDQTPPNRRKNAFFALRLTENNKLDVLEVPQRDQLKKLYDILDRAGVCETWGWRFDKDVERHGSYLNRDLHGVGELLVEQSIVGPRCGNRQSIVLPVPSFGSPDVAVSACRIVSRTSHCLACKSTRQ